jgi:hypothetical protein
VTDEWVYGRNSHRAVWTRGPTTRWVAAELVYYTACGDYGRRTCATCGSDFFVNGYVYTDERHPNKRFCSVRCIPQE